ncbi:MAG: type II secretion system protein GspG [Candidatus Riflebacteria bacterium]|nr:type II secretion system protein GspG [Candidatus Riflebacteria bacterium]
MIFLKRSGLSLFELLIVFGILIILISHLLPFHQGFVAKSNITAAQADLDTFAKALSLYDQLEPAAWNSSTDLRGLIGKYLQDFRTTGSDQKMPRDPWGNDYVVDNAFGYILSKGLNGKTDSIKRFAIGDDILITWKSPFFVSVKYNNPTSYDLIFSRKVNTAIFPLTAEVIKGSDAVQLTTDPVNISDTQFHCMLSTPLVTGYYVVTVDDHVTARDGQTLGAEGSNPNGGPSTQDTLVVP